MTFIGHEKSINTIEQNSNESLMFSGSSDCTIRVWKVYNAELVYTIKLHTSSVTQILLNDKNDKIISCSLDKTIRIICMDRYKELQCFVGHKGYIQSITQDNKNKIVQSASSDKTVRKFDFNGKILLTMQKHTDSVLCVQLNLMNDKLYSGGADGCICVWDTYLGTLLNSFQAHSKGMVKQILC